MSDLKIHWESLPRLWTAMETTGDQGVDIARYFSAYACDTSGIDYEACALQPLGPAFEQMSEWFWQMERTFTTRWNALEDATSRTIAHIDEVDGGVRQQLARYTREIDVDSDGRIISYAAVDVADFHLDDLGDALEAPEDGEDRLKHSTDFMAVSDGYDAARDGINTIVGFVNTLLPGDPLPSLPDRSLRDYLIYPLSGNYHRLQANAAGCRTVGTAMGVWAGNVGTVAAKAPIAFDGRTGAAFAGQLTLYATVMKGVGVAVGRGSSVLDAIARMSEEIALRVEKAVVILGQALLRLARKLVSRLTSWLGWLLTVAEFVAKGWELFEDIARDIKVVVLIITSLDDLVREVKAWAELQAERLRDFRELVVAVRDLPPLAEVTTLRAAADADLLRVKKAVEKIKEDFGPQEGKDERKGRSLLERLDGLVKDAASRPKGSDQPAGPDPTPPRAPEPGEVTPAPRDPSPTPSPSAGPVPSAPSPSAPSSTPTPPAPSATPSAP